MFNANYFHFYTLKTKAERIHTEWQNYICGYAVALDMLKAGLVKSGCSQMNKASSLSLCLCRAPWFSSLIILLGLAPACWSLSCIWALSTGSSMQVWALDQPSLLLIQPSIQLTFFAARSHCSYIQLFHKSIGSFFPKLLASQSALSLFCCMGFFVSGAGLFICLYWPSWGSCQFSSQMRSFE